LLRLADLRAAPQLADLAVLQKGSRLSITPVTTSQWQRLAPLMGCAA